MPWGTREVFISLRGWHWMKLYRYWCVIFTSNWMNVPTTASQELDLQANSLSSQTTTELGKMFAINKTLQRLNLDWNFLYTEPKPFTLFCRGLIKNVSITSLSLAWNGFLGTGFMRALIRGTRRIPIKTLNLESNMWVRFLELLYWPLLNASKMFSDCEEPRCQLSTP